MPQIYTFYLIPKNFKINNKIFFNTDLITIFVNAIAIGRL